MNLFDLVDQLRGDTLTSLRLFRAELALCATIVVMLLLRVFTWRRHAFLVALIGSAIGLYLALPWNQGDAPRQYEIFTGMLVYDGLTVFFRSLLLVFAVLFMFFTRLSGIPDREDSPDFYTLVLGATLGMCIMASANHLLTIFLGVEMASVPSYALAGMLKGRRQSSEAALKYAVFGAGTAGVMLYGISLLAGVLGSVHLPTMAVRLATLIANTNSADPYTPYFVLALGGLMVMVGLAFKLSAVPFHFWCPDVFEGASAEVAAFLSVSSKAAALALLIRVTVGFGFVQTPVVNAPLAVTVTPTNAAATATSPAMNVPPAASAGVFSVADPADQKPAAANATTPSETPARSISTADQIAALHGVRSFICLLVGFIAAITCTFGNLAAYGQTNIKRMLAYSTIAHAGYMMLPISAAMALAGEHSDLAQSAISSILFYTGVYLFMNLGAFAVVAFLRNALRSEQIADYAGLIRRCPGVVICFGTLLISLIGLPPLAGFAAKFVVFASLFRAMQAGTAQHLMLTLAVVAGLNTALGLFYYLRVIKVMALDPEPADRLPVTFPLVSLQGAFLVVVTLPVLLLGVWWSELQILADRATAHLFR